MSIVWIPKPVKPTKKELNRKNKIEEPKPVNLTQSLCEKTQTLLNKVTEKETLKNIPLSELLCISNGALRDAFDGVTHLGKDRLNILQKLLDTEDMLYALPVPKGKGNIGSCWS